MPNQKDEKPSKEKVKKTKRSVEEIMQPFRSYKMQEHKKPNYVRQEELLAIIKTANRAKKDLAGEIESACKEMGREIKKLLGLQSKILKDAGILGRRKRTKKKTEEKEAS